MKKILFILTFAFIGHQAFSQMYIVTYSNAWGVPLHPSNCTPDYVLTKVDPTGNVTYTCVDHKRIFEDPAALVTINQELNSIINQGYKLIHTSSVEPSGGPAAGTINADGFVNTTIWYFAIPWNASGLEEVSTTLKSFIISPNPANSHVDISLDYSLSGESEVLFINDSGYIIHKESIQRILKNEKYNIDISKLFSGKYLVTIVNGKTYTTPKKMIVL